MSNISFKLSDEKISKLKDTFKDDIKQSSNEYIDTLIQNEDLTISIYKSKKVVFQGKDALFFASAYLDHVNNRQAGSDEVGTGDYFGPVVVCACIIEKEDYDFIEINGITDSKKMTDEKIMSLGPTLIEKFKHSLLILDPDKYNKVHETNNMVEIKCKLHNKAYVNLISKGYSIPKAAYVDQFVNENSYYSYVKDEKEVYHDLIFETKAEEKYPAVAVASVIARYAFLSYFNKMNEAYKMTFHKGASDEVDKDAKEFVERYGEKSLGKVAKLHFKNTDKLRAML